MELKISRLPLIAFDLLILFLAGAVIFILLTGGRIFYIGKTLIQLQGIENPITFLYFLIVIRVLLDRKTPFLGSVSLSIERIIRSCNVICQKLYLAISNLQSNKLTRVVIIIIGISLVIKIFNAYHYYGFFSGDDVEVHEMTFAHLFDWDTKAWNLRSPFFPMVFIFPLQAALYALGVYDPFYLIFAGRMIIVLFSLVNLYLVFIIASRLFKSKSVGLLSLLFFALNKLHTTMGSSELPRTVASTFILLSFWFLLSEKNQRIFLPLASVSLAIGASIRFGEAVFVVPAFIYLVFHKRLRQAVLLAVFFLTSFAVINFISDQLYWGQPFFSLKNIVDYTIVKGQSTRGYQSFLYYLIGLGLWTNYFSFGLMLLSLRQNLNKIWIWVAAPILILSFLPHKEPRYLLPLIPFFCIMVGLSTWTLLEKIYHNKLNFDIYRKISKPVFALLIVLVGVVFLAHKDPRFSYLVFLLSGLIGLIYLAQKKREQIKGVLSPYRKAISLHVSSLLVFALLGVVVFEVNGSFFRKPASGVEMARYLYSQPDNNGVAVEDIWRAGGKLYLWRKRTLINIDRSSIEDRNSFISDIKENSIDWVGIRENSIKQHGYDVLLKEIGFTEVRFSKKVRLETYRLFKRENTD